MRIDLILLIVATLLAIGFYGHYASNPDPNEKEMGSEVRVNPAASEAAFDKMMQVLTHPRCTNCHPSDGVPKQGDDAHPHYFGIARGKDDHGFEATRCHTCHQSENNDFSGVPGAPEWALAPHSMRWQGLSRTEIARSMLDRERNGDRTHDQIKHHLTEDPLVLWAWEPGIDASGEPREPPPVGKEAFIAAVEEWFAGGAVIPHQ